jgi:hypothetical protein
LNEEDFADTGPFTFYKEPRLAVFVTALQPEGGVSEGGTLVTVRGAGFDVMSAGIALAHVRCRWGSIHAVGNDTAALSVSSTEIVCPSSPLPEGMQNLSIALNGQQFFATNLRLLVYPQPSTFTQAALNTVAANLRVAFCICSKRGSNNEAGLSSGTPGGPEAPWFGDSGFSGSFAATHRGRP